MTLSIGAATRIARSAKSADSPARVKRKASGGGKAVAAARSDTSLRDRAYALIKERIIKLHYPPGTCLNEAQVSADLEIGRTPVHLAINILEQEDLVEVLPRKGVIVRPLSMQDMQSVFEVRLMNEPIAARLAALRATEEDLQGMQRLVAEARALKSPTTDQLIASDRAFHLAIADATKNRVLSQFLRTLHDRALRQWYATYQYVTDGFDNNVSQHAEMVAALVARDATEAERLMRAHIERTVDVFGRNLSPAAALTR